MCVAQWYLIKYVCVRRWIHNSEVALGGQQYGTQYATYAGGGYVALLGKSYASARIVMDRLFSGLWIDRGTRVIFVDFTVYNPNINLFGVCKCAPLHCTLRVLY